MQTPAGRDSARLEVMDVVNRYAAAIDARDWDRLRSCFAPGAQLQLPKLLIEGPSAIAEFMAKAVAGRAWQQHLVGSHQIRVEGDRAWSTCALCATQVPVDPAEPIVTTMGTYHDELRLTADGWKITHRELRVGHVKREGGSG